MRINQSLLAKFLLVTDVTVLAISLFTAYWLRQNVFRLWYDPIQPWWVYVWLWLGSILIFSLLGQLKGIYNWQEVLNINQNKYLWRVWESGFIFGLLIMSGSYLVKYDFSRIVVILWWLLVLIAVPLIRLWLNYWFQRRFDYRILIVGRNKTGRRFVKVVSADFIFPIQIESLAKLPSHKNEDWDEMIIVDSSLDRDKIFNWLSREGKFFKKISLALNIFPKIFNDPSLHLNYKSLPRLSFNQPNWFDQKLKRLTDITLSILLLLLFSPLIIGIAIFIFLKTKNWPVIKLKRVGYKGRLFVFYKFLTMRGPIKEAKSPRSIRDNRIYAWGRWLRRTSLDELPQFINVIKGEMSLVGPRPEMRLETAKYKPWQKIRLEVKPGLTGLWQVLGRKDLPLNQNLQYDLYYVANRNFWFDLLILIKTPWVVLTGRGAY